MKDYEIWTEGFRATAERGGAHYHGTVTANSLDKAVEKLAKKNSSFDKYVSYSPNPKRKGSSYTYWGCRIFDNEEQARKSFG